MAGLVAEVDGAGSVVLPFARRCRNAETTNIPVEFQLSPAFLIFLLTVGHRKMEDCEENHLLCTNVRFAVSKCFCTAIVLGDKMQTGKREKKIRKSCLLGVLPRIDGCSESEFRKKRYALSFVRQKTNLLQ